MRIGKGNRRRDSKASARPCPLERAFRSDGQFLFVGDDDGVQIQREPDSDESRRWRINEKKSAKKKK